MNRAFLAICAASALSFASTGDAQTLQQSLEDVGVGGRWKYNDLESAKAAAIKSKKPILALFR